MDEKTLLELAQKNFNSLEISRDMGEPRQPDKAAPYFIDAIADYDTATGGEPVYIFDAVSDTEVIYVVTDNGEITQSAVTADTPTQVTFVDIQTPEYYAKLKDLASAREKTLARKLVTIERAMDSYECYLVRTLLDTAATSSSNLFTLDSGDKKLDFLKLVDMCEAVEDYGTDLKMIAGATVAKDKRTMEYDANRYVSVKEALADLNIEWIRHGLKASARTFSLDDDNSGGTASTNIIPATYAYLVATSTEMGKPVTFVRKEVNQVELFGVMGAQNGSKQYRYVFVGPNPVVYSVGTKRTLGVSFVGFGEIAAFVKTPQAVARFERA